MSLQPLPDAPGRCRLRVQDDGIGLPVDFSLRQQASLGLQLVQNLAAQLNLQTAVWCLALFGVRVGKAQVFRCRIRRAGARAIGHARPARLSRDARRSTGGGTSGTPPCAFQVLT